MSLTITADLIIGVPLDILGETYQEKNRTLLTDTFGTPTEQI
jgi:hypothetical protein